MIVNPFRLGFTDWQHGTIPLICSRRYTIMRTLLLFSLVFLLLSGCVQEPSEAPAMEERLEELEERVGEVEETVGIVEERVEQLEEEVEELAIEMDEDREEEVVVPPPKGTVRFLVTVENVHDTQTLSPGVFIVHKPLVSINFVGRVAPAELEPLAEYGNHTPFKEYVESNEGVVAVYTIDEPLPPGEKKNFTMDISTYRPRENYLSGIMMATGSNDGFVLASNIALFNPGNGPKGSITDALNYDAGTEENSPPLSGFEGGQPDPTRGEENIDNGIATTPPVPVTFHTQLTKTIMKVTVTPQ